MESRLSSNRLNIAGACAGASVVLLLARDSLIHDSTSLETAGFYAALLWGFSLFAGLWLLFGEEFFSRRFVGRASAESIAFVRIVCLSILLASTLWEDLASIVLIPAEASRPVGVLEILHRIPGVTALSRDATALSALKWGTALFLLLGAIGWKTRVVLPVAAFGYLIIGGLLREYSWSYDTGLVPLWVLFALCFTRCGDALSLDARAKRRAGEPALAESEAYAWSRTLCWAVVSVSYLSAGLSKLMLGGLDWLNPLHLKSTIISNSLDLMHFDFGIGPHLLEVPDQVFVFLAGAILIVELGYAAVLFSRKARLFFPILAIAMHLGSLLLQNTLYFDLILLQLIFLDERTLRAGLRKIGIGAGVEVGAEAGIEAGIEAGTEAGTEAGLGEPIEATSSPARPLPSANSSPPLSPPLVGSPRLSALTSLFLAALLAVCTQHQRYYPFSPFIKYADPNTRSVVSYLELTGTTTSGEVVDIRIEDEIGALVDGRSRRIVRGVFGAKNKLLIVNQLLLTWGELHNANLPSEDRIVKVKIARRIWNYELEPDDPARGVAKRRYAYPLKSAKPNASPR